MSNRNYLCSIALLSDVATTDAESLVGKIRGIVERLGGRVTNVEKPGVKKMAYRIRGRAEGLFYQVSFEAPPAAVNEIEGVLRLHEGVLRYMTTKASAPRPAAGVQEQAQSSPVSASQPGP